MSAQKKATKAPEVDPLKTVLDPADVTAFMAENGITVEALLAGRAAYPRDSAPPDPPLTLSDIEQIMAMRDPVQFAAFFLRETGDWIDDETGEVVIARGSPWKLVDVQKTMARFGTVLDPQGGGDFVFECGASVGKTRDICLRSLWRSHFESGIKILIGAASDAGAKQFLAMFESQTTPARAQTPPGFVKIAGGVTRIDRSLPYYIQFQNQSEIQVRLSSNAGRGFRDFHGKSCYGDEAAIWQGRRAFTEFFSRRNAGGEIRLYSTPNGDRSSAWAGIVARAIPCDDRPADEDAGREKGEAVEHESRYRKFRIPRTALGYPLWTPKQEAKAIAEYGSTDAAEFQQNILGLNGDSVESVFPRERIETCRGNLPDYRAVFVEVDREAARAAIRVSRLSGDVRGDPEVILVDHRFGRTREAVAREIAAHFPEPRGRGQLVIGCDLGTSKRDPCEWLCVEIIEPAREGAGATWSDLFRVYLANATWPEVCDTVIAVDHAAGHRNILWVLDITGVGAGPYGDLKEPGLVCPECGEEVNLPSRMTGYNFWATTEDVNPDTGRAIVDTENLNSAGVAQAITSTVKEISTRLLERKVDAMQLRIAFDNGAGVPALASAQLLQNHTADGMRGAGGRRGSRTFKGKDDHHVDARRLVAMGVSSIASTKPRLYMGGADPALIVRGGDPDNARRFSRAGEPVDAFKVTRKNGVEQLKQTGPGEDVEPRESVADGFDRGGVLGSMRGGGW